MSTADPTWAYEPVVLRPPDPRWADRADRERVRLAELLSPWLADGIEHIGSTAVSGLAAKPIVDLMASVGDLEAVTAQAAGPLADDGWCYVPPELDGREAYTDAKSAFVARVLRHRRDSGAGGT